MNKKKITKRYFVGGDIAGTLGQAASGDLAGLAATTINNGMTSGNLMDDPNITQGQKFALMAGNLGGGIIGGQIANSIVGNQLAETNQTNNEFNSLIRANNMMESGGSLLEFGGYSHDDQNPNNVNGGNLIKSDGQNNHVTEKGETLKDDYVYSDTLLVPYGKHNGKTFAEASKVIDKLYSERSNDIIFKRAKERDLKELAQINDSVREQQELTEETEYRCGGKMYFNGGKIKEGEFDVEDFSPEELAHLDKLGYDVEIL